ncbi:cytochrome b5-like heme/steroid binding domain containing protein [Nitzschia inconspicua]|uniref:Cytochrome b5-like heme/steroid binding domain containing protein n=1 Tax=Nitzschia inconspicua TaxID=303405 RepID=A0A9K3LTL1_9STRA|nr:cytochrome b5-like heme/steroid binding domain containing protein [Nitzschia inconspicua]
MIQQISLLVDSWTGISGSLGYLVIFVIVLITHQLLSVSRPHPITTNMSNNSTTAKEETKVAVDPPRNFTAKQLAYFDGTKDEKTGEDKPVYLSVNGTVFDVSDGRNFYGPDGPYEKFAGKECGVALAKMSFDEQHLGNLKGCSTELNFGERTELEGWIEKFTYYRNYPIKGKLVDDDDLSKLSTRILTADDLAQHTGESGQDIPEGYATAPIYIGAGNKVFDASFGGVEFYGSGGGYNKFAGRDISRALAKMSFDPEDLQNTNIDDLTDKQRKVLDDWIETFQTKKGYPIVGTLGKE